MSIFLHSCEAWTLTSEVEKFQTSPWHLVQRPHHQRRGAKQDSESHWTLRRTLVHCKKTQHEVVWACHKSLGICLDSPPGHCTGRQKERKTEKAMRRKHPGLDGFGTERRREKSRGTRGMANVGGQIVWCPNGPQDYGIDR